MPEYFRDELDEDPTDELQTIQPMEIGGVDDDDDNVGGSRMANGSSSSSSSKQPSHGQYVYYLNGKIRAQKIGNMKLFFPEYFDSSGWGVLGPHWHGPVCVWGILVIVTHFCLNSARKIGFGSELICYGFFTACTFCLTDVALRDPGICLFKEVPSSVPPSEIHQWRWCDLCQVYQPPGAVHCVSCNVCVMGYDHYCVWMGTCIGKRNYRQFVRFNVSWLYYLLYVFFWLKVFGPLIFG